MQLKIYIPHRELELLKGKYFINLSQVRNSNRIIVSILNWILLKILIYLFHNLLAISLGEALSKLTKIHSSTIFYDISYLCLTKCPFLIDKHLRKFIGISHGVWLSKADFGIS